MRGGEEMNTGIIILFTLIFAAITFLILYYCREEEEPKSDYEKIPLKYIEKNKEFFLRYTTGTTEDPIKEYRLHTWYYLPASKLVIADMRGYIIYINAQNDLYICTEGSEYNVR